MTAPYWWYLILGLFVASVALRNGLLFLIAVLLVLIVAASRLWSRYGLAEVTYRRRLGATHLNFGEDTDLWIEIVNAKPLPLAWLRTDDEQPIKVQMLTGKTATSHKPTRAVLTNLLSLRWYERVTRHYRLRGTQRGLHEFGPVELQTGDIFGFSHQRLRIDDVQTLVVYPRLVPLTHFGLPSRRPFGDSAAPRRLLEDPLRLMGVRDYAPGDSFRHVHWKATARTGRLQTKVYEPTTTYQLIVFLDTQTMAHAYQGIVPEYLELGATAAGSVVQYALEEGYAVGLRANASVRHLRDLVSIAPGRNPDQLPLILDALACLSPYGNASMAGLLSTAARTLPLGTTVVVISSNVSEYLIESLLSVRAGGHAVSLLAMGETGPARVDGIATYWIGGQRAWHDLESLSLA
jgi:uncharacterized protein (DUF58 family)